MKRLFSVMVVAFINGVGKGVSIFIYALFLGLALTIGWGGIDLIEGTSTLTSEKMRGLFTISFAFLLACSLLIDFINDHRS